MTSTELPSHVLLRLSAQRALWGAITPNLRAVSADIRGTVIRWRADFDLPPTEEELELLSVAATEVIADFPAPWTIDEEVRVIPSPTPMEHLTHLLFLRHE